MRWLAVVVNEWVLATRRWRWDGMVGWWGGGVVVAVVC